MTELRFFSKKINGIPVGPESRFPALRDPIPSTIASKLADSDGLFINYGMFFDSLPYAMQDEYDLTPVQPMELPSAVLENEHLIAEFTLSMGGRLWRLYDKDRKMELLTNNQEFLPRNLAIRNAWFAGGTEWNCGRRGHDANTCSPRFAAELHDPEYGPVLRIYDYSRDRKTPYQMDFFLPPGSRFLYSRVRLSNPNPEVTPMYWWSNIAVPMTPGARVVVPATNTYANIYENGNHFIINVDLPNGEGFDSTYPENFVPIRDHFYNIPEDSRKYEALIRRDGTGFIHLSTRRLQGRKLFVWGQCSGSYNWQRKLLSEGEPDYLELQGGLAKTQQEHLPMPPCTTWEWLEAYGGITAEPEKIFGEWPDAIQAVTAWADRELPEKDMDRILADTCKTIAIRPGELRFSGIGYAALEEKRSGKKLAPQLDFGTTGEDQQEWCDLLENGRMDDAPPRSYQVDPAWAELLKKAPKSWKRDYHLGIYNFRQQDWERALQFSVDALKANRNAWTLHLLGNVLLQSEDSPDNALAMLDEAARMPEADAYLVKDVLKLLVLHGRNAEAISLYEVLPPIHQARPMAKLQYAMALARTGKEAEAEAILLENGGLQLPDAREGAGEITDLFIKLQKNKGIPEDQIDIPLVIDYRLKQ